MKTEQTTDIHDRLVLTAVRHPDLYARKVCVLESELGLTAEQIIAVASRNPQLGLFTHNNEQFIGLTERKAAYDEDASRGINPFEPNYRGDEQRALVLGGRPRFPTD